MQSKRGGNAVEVTMGWAGTRETAPLSFGNKSCRYMGEEEGLQNGDAFVFNDHVARVSVKLMNG